jgi:hypothetical protein
LLLISRRFRVTRQKETSYLPPCRASPGAADSFSNFSQSLIPPYPVKTAQLSIPSTF